MIAVQTPTPEAPPRPAVAVPPWVAEPYRLWSLLEMQRLLADRLLGAYSMAQRQLSLVSMSPGNVKDHNRQDWKRLIENWRPDFASAGLSLAVAQLDRINGQLDNMPTVSNQLMTSLLNELLNRVRDQLEETYCLLLSGEEARRFETPIDDKWRPVVDRFPSTADDVEEAAKCLAVGRHTAAVFHLMRVVEVGLRALGRSLNDSTLDPASNPNWERILTKCDSELRRPLRERSDEWRSDEPFYSEATANLRSIKDAWRNPTLHVERHYDEERAEEVYHAVRAFMRHLATKLGP